MLLIRYWPTVLVCWLCVSFDPQWPHSNRLHNLTYVVCVWERHFDWVLSYANGLYSDWWCMRMPLSLCLFAAMNEWLSAWLTGTDPASLSFVCVCCMLSMLSAYLFWVGVCQLTCYSIMVDERDSLPTFAPFIHLIRCLQCNWTAQTIYKNSNIVCKCSSDTSLISCNTCCLTFTLRIPYLCTDHF